jgi:O-antigen/teichoic acid export membrane protein
MPSLIDCRSVRISTAATDDDHVHAIESDGGSSGRQLPCPALQRVTQLGALRAALRWPAGVQRTLIGSASARFGQVPAKRFAAHVRTPLYGNAYALMASDIAGGALGMLYWALAARFYAAEVVGVNSAAISTMMFLAGVSQLNLMGVLIRFIPRAGRATGRLVGRAYLASVAVAAGVGLVFVLGLDIWAPTDNFLRANPAALLWFVVATSTWCVFALQDYALMALHRAGWVPIENAVFGLAKIILLIVLATSVREYGIFVSWTVPMVLVVIPITVLMFRSLVPKHVVATEARAEAVTLRQVVSYGAGNFLGSLFFLMSTTLLPLLVIYRTGVNANAFFYLAWTATYPLQLIGLNMATSLTVEGASDETQLGIYIRRTLVQSARLLLPAVTVASVAAWYVLRLFGEDYAEEGTTVFRLLALSAIPNVVNALFISVARVQRRVMGIAVVQGVLALLTLALSYLLLPGTGITGVGIARLVSQSAVAIVVWVAVLGPSLQLKVRREGSPLN